MIQKKWAGLVGSATATMALLGGGVSTLAQQERALGLDISAWQGNISQTTWDNIRNVENRQFVVLRSSRGGTTGYYNQSNAGNNNPPGQNTLSQRYDDPYFIQNINRATTAGMFAGTYHFSRPDIITNTLNSAGIANTGTDEADHFMQMAGPWMRPGFLVPIHDLEAGDGKRTDEAMAQFCIDFSNRIYERMGIRPGIYVNGNYASSVLGGASASLRNELAEPSSTPPSLVSPTYPTLWSARWPNQADPNSIDVQNSEPKDSYAPIYGPWDDYGVTHPWKFWQYASTGRLQSFNNGGNNLDFDVARGGVEFLKDCLVPAVWMNDIDGEWTTLVNWNSGQIPIPPVTGPGQVAPVGTQTLPTPRLPESNDTVIIERLDITVTLSSGTQNIRKLYLRNNFNITGGSLNINYVPSWDSTTNAAQFSSPVTLSGSGSLSLHTLQVDAAQSFTLGGGTLTFNTINLMPDSFTPAKIVMNGDVSLNSLSDVAARIQNGGGSGSSGLIDLGGASRSFTIGDGTNDIDLSIDVPLSNGALAKVGPGTMRLTTANSYSAGTIINAGRLLVNNLTGSGTGSGVVTVNAGTLGGSGIIAGVVTVASGGTISPGTSIGTLTFNSAPTLNGTNFMEINRNDGSSLADKVALTSGTLNYGGALVVSNVGATLVGGEVFTNFTASAYTGAFANTSLPALNSGLNWYLGGLTTNGTIKVNRSPTINSVTVTNIFPDVLKIPIASLTTNGADADGDTLLLSAFGPATTNGVTLTTDNTFLIYSNNVNIADKFTFIISDNRGGTATNTVTIAPSRVVTGEFAGQPTVSENSVTLHFSGTSGQTYYVERSTNLPPAWLTISTNIAPENGLFDYTDNFQDLGGPPSTAFYRLRWLP